MDALQASTEWNESDRVRNVTADAVNRDIDEAIRRRVEAYQGRSPEEVSRRIEELEKEWDIERVLEVNASTLALVGLALGATQDRRWFALPAVVMGFLLQHGLQGWCPPVPVFRRLGVRTREEIDREKYALRQLLDDAYYV